MGVGRFKNLCSRLLPKPLYHIYLNPNGFSDFGQSNFRFGQSNFRFGQSNFRFGQSNFRFWSIHFQILVNHSVMSSLLKPISDFGQSNFRFWSIQFQILVNPISDLVNPISDFGQSRACQEGRQASQSLPGFSEPPRLGRP